ncbi:diguanylate cyclase [Paenibacillus athensensis]|uniref:GGDEF domain-containing protein n=1 Tax=Paenibacillus athensensis TaxID=1967502 RepID=A0A4Y8Q717_9BACL|nr:diguanylate cyclase [Paenibacillus athensensis]MCD1259856.1 diguanylate cyclase [Paenibacillus athensensis]
MNEYLIPLTSACTLVTLNYIAMKIRGKMLVESYEDWIAPLFTGLASIIMMLQPLPLNWGLADLRSLPIFMAGLRYGLPVALISTIFPTAYGIYSGEPHWLFNSIQDLLMPALISSFFHTKEYRTGLKDIRLGQGLLICTLLLALQLLIAFYVQPSAAWHFWAGQLFMLAIMAGALTILIIMVNDENKSWMLQRQLELQANQDGLTKLPNLRSFTAIAAKTMQRRRVSIFMIDIDNFKMYNDRFGHLEGDELLRTVGATLRQLIDERDYVARYGGEEFILLSTETERQRLAVYADRLCKAIAAQNLSIPELSEGPPPSITISIGISTAVRAQDDLQRVIAEADEALYASKHSGKNRYTFHNAAVPDDKKTNA